MYFNKSGNPKPEVKWYYGDERIKPKKGDKRIRSGYDINNDMYVLQIQSAVIEDSGLYSVKISNEHGSTKATVSVSISKESVSLTPIADANTIVETNKVSIVSSFTEELKDEHSLSNELKSVLTSDTSAKIPQTEKITEVVPKLEITSEHFVDETLDDNEAKIIVLKDDIAREVNVKVEQPVSDEQMFTDTMENKKRTNMTMEEETKTTRRVILEESLENIREHQKGSLITENEIGLTLSEDECEEISHEDDQLKEDDQRRTKQSSEILSENETGVVQSVPQIDMQPVSKKGSRPLLVEKPTPVSTQEGTPFTLFCKVQG